MTGSIVAARNDMRFHTSLLAAVLSCLLLATGPAAAQDRDSLLNGAVIGAAAGAGVGIAFTHAVRDSDLSAGQYARSAVIFGALGAGAGAGFDALLSRTNHPVFTSRRLRLAPAFWRKTSALVVKLRW